MLSPSLPKLLSGLWHSSHFHPASRLPWHVFVGELETCLMLGELTWHALVGEPKTCLHVRWISLTRVGPRAQKIPSMFGEPTWHLLVAELETCLHVRWIDLTCIGCWARNVPSCLVNSLDVCRSLSWCELTRRVSIVELMCTDSTCVGCWAHVNWLDMCQLPSSCELTRRVSSSKTNSFMFGELKSNWTGLNILHTVSSEIFSQK